MSSNADTGLFEVMEVDEDAGELMIFPEDQLDHSEFSHEWKLLFENEP